MPRPCCQCEKRNEICMDTIINELISYDRQARAIIEEALQAKEKSERELPEEAKRLYDDFLSRAKDRVARIQESVQSDHEEEIAQLEQSYQLAVDKLKETYENNRENWCQQLFERCVAQE